MNKASPLNESYTFIAMLKFALPSIFMMLFMGLYSITDTIMVARFINTDALSALNIVCPILNLMVGIGTMIATGGNAIIAKKLGAKDNKSANESMTLLMLFTLIIGLIVMIFAIINIDAIVWGLGASRRLFTYGKDYLSILLLFAPACMLQIYFQSTMITAGKPVMGLLFTVSAGIANILFDYIFIIPLHMGMKGAALGTGISYVIPCLLSLFIFIKKKSDLHFTKPIFSFIIILKSCSNGVSEMISQISTAITTFLFNLIMMKLLKEQGVAAITMIIYSQFMLTSLYIGFSMGIAPIIAYQYGANQHNQLKRICKQAVMFIAVLSLFIWLLSFFKGSSLISLFTIQDKAVFTIAQQGFTIFKYAFLFCGFNIFFSSMFTALSNGLASATISFLRTFIFITVFLLLLPNWLGIQGVWLAVPLAELITLFVSVYLIYRNRNRYHYLS